MDKAESSAQLADIRCRLATQQMRKWFSQQDGECDKWIIALELVTKWMKGNKLGVVVKSSAGSSKHRLPEALKKIEVDSARALVNVGRL